VGGGVVGGTPWGGEKGVGPCPVGGGGGGGGGPGTTLDFGRGGGDLCCGSGWAGRSCDSAIFWLPHFADRSPPEPIRSSDPYPCVDRDPSFPFPPLPPLRSKYQGPKTQVAATCAGLVVSNFTVLSHAVRMTRKELTSLAGCYNSRRDVPFRQ